jgi:hypothetical protein
MKHKIARRPRPMKQIILNVIDDEDSLERMLNAIKECSDPGHSFDVVVDPDGTEEEGGNLSFGIDGDGAFRLVDIKIKEVVA